jgi:hypothetical protein
VATAEATHDPTVPGLAPDYWQSGRKTVAGLILVPRVAHMLPTHLAPGKMRAVSTPFGFSSGQAATDCWYPRKSLVSPSAEV